MKLSLVSVTTTILATVALAGAQPILAAPSDDAADLWSRSFQAIDSEGDVFARSFDEDLVILERRKFRELLKKAAKRVAQSETLKGIGREVAGVAVSSATQALQNKISVSVGQQGVPQYWSPPRNSRRRNRKRNAGGRRVARDLDVYDELD